MGAGAVRLLRLVAMRALAGLRGRKSVVGPALRRP